MKKMFYPLLILLFLGGLNFLTPLYAGNGQMMFVAHMSAEREVPPVRSDALGMMTFLVSEDRTTVQIHGVFANLTGSITGCHIHFGAEDTTGPVIIDLSSFVTGNRIVGTIPLPPGWFGAASLGDLYVNVHTTVHPSGEIRGQLTWMAELIIPALLSGVEEVPPVSTDAVGLGAFRFSQNLTSLQYEIKAIGLSGPITGCHIHQAAAGADGPVIADLGNGAFITGTITNPLEIITILLAIFNGEAYVNIHTDANPGGEIRAQLGFDALNNGSGILNGDQENPPVTTSANGYGYAALQFPNLDTLYYAVVFEGITPTNAHIHRAPAGMNGPIVTPLTPSGIPDTYLGFVPLNDLNLTAFLKDELYFNIHSSSFPGGEIRGQITNNLMKSFAFDLCSDQVVPAKTLPAYGAAYAAVNKANTEMEYGLMVEQFNGDAVTTQVREGSVGMNGALLLSLENPIPYAVNVITLPPGVGGKIDIDRAYVSIHTAANPSGEVRGQIRRGLSCKINVGNVETAIREIRLKQNLVHGFLELEADSDEDAEVQIRVTNASGQQTKSWNRSFFAGTTPVQLEVDDLVSGLYFLQVQEKHHAVKSFKFVKP